MDQQPNDQAALIDAFFAMRLAIDLLMLEDSEVAAALLNTIQRTADRAIAALDRIHGPHDGGAGEEGD